MYTCCIVTQVTKKPLAPQVFFSHAAQNPPSWPKNSEKQRKILQLFP
jgi:hypothetical protein